VVRRRKGAAVLAKVIRVCRERLTDALRDDRARYAECNDAWDVGEIGPQPPSSACS